MSEIVQRTFEDITGQKFTVIMEKKEMGLVGVSYKRPGERVPFKFKYSRRENFPWIHSKKIQKVILLFSFLRKEGIRMPEYSRGLILEIASKYLRKEKKSDEVRDLVFAYIYLMC